MNRLPFLNKILIFYLKHAQIANNLGWLFFDKILRMGVGLIVGVWVARYLGVQDFGALNYAMAIVAITGVFATMGIESLVVKKLIEAPEFKNEILTTAFFIKFFGAIIGLVTTFLYCYFANESLTLPLILSIGTLFLAMDVVDYYNQSKINSKIIVILRSISFIITSALRIYAIINHFPVFYFAIIISLELFVSFILMYFSMKEIFLRFTNFSKPIAKEFIKKGFPLLFASFTVIVYMKIDQIMIAEMINIKSVGIYSAAIKISEMIYFIPVIIMSTFFPFLIKSNINFHEKIYIIYKLMITLSLVISTFISILSNYIIEALYGNLYKESSNILIIHVWASIFVFVGVASNQYLIINNLSKYSFYQTLLGALSNIILNLILIPYYGAFGAAIATLVSYGISAYLSNLIFEETRSNFKLISKSFTFVKY